MREIHKDIYKIINGSKTSTGRDKDNRTIINDSASFKGLPLSKIDLITDITENAIKGNFQDKGIVFDSIASANERSKKFVTDIAVSMTRDKSSAKKIYDSMFNNSTSVANGVDPTMDAQASPNIWISPYEANTLYSQKGLAELIINKKSKSILLNGLKIKNRKLTADQIDKVSLNMLRLDIPKVISDAVRDSLVYGGDLVYPMFYKDSPVSMGLNLVALIKQGILGKGTISHIISLDRWNVVHVPSTNPTQKDFLLPEKYYIPYLGADVHGSRACRIITSAQAGFFGQVMTMGWGLSDFSGFYREMMNYKISIQTLPMMIQQMSILARSINIDGVLAQEGANIMDALLESDTIRVSQWSANNPITLDMLGELKVINRDFAEVPALLRLLRQDLAAAATVPEPMIFSSEKGNFSSGDDAQGDLAKQYESTKFIHKDVETQFKQLAKMLIIDALGTSQTIIEALPYTEIHFDVPMVANSTERAEIGLNISRSFFELVAGQMPLDKAAEIASGYGGDELSIDSELLASLKTRQSEADERVKNKYEKEMEIMQKQIDAPDAVPGEGSGAPKTGVKKEAKEYSKLEQAQHSNTRMPGEKRPEQLAKRS